MLEEDERYRMPKRMYMVVESFKNKDAVAVYRRFRDKGRLAPEGTSYVSSWVDDKLERCYQLMECDDRDYWTSGSRTGATSCISRYMP